MTFGFSLVCSLHMVSLGCLVVPGRAHCHPVSPTPTTRGLLLVLECDPFGDTVCRSISTLTPTEPETPIYSGRRAWRIHDYRTSLLGSFSVGVPGQRSERPVKGSTWRVSKDGREEGTWTERHIPRVLYDPKNGFVFPTRGNWGTGVGNRRVYDSSKEWVSENFRFIKC